MSCRDILVQVDATAPSRTRAATAAALAHRFGAHLTGVFLRTSFPAQYFEGGPYWATPAGVLHEVIQRHNEAVDKAEEAARQTFEAVADEAGVRSDWLSLSGDTQEPMADCMRRADLTILPRDPDPVLGQSGISPAQLGLTIGGPILVLPDPSPGQTVGERVLVAWNGKREAARALRDAWTFIAAAQQVHVLIVGPKGGDGPDSRLQRHFEHHGCEADVIVDRSEDASAGRVILETAAALKADLVVMGLYGHGRLREFILGGATRELLQQAPIPVLISH